MKLQTKAFFPGLLGLLFAATASAQSWTQIGCGSASDGPPHWNQLNQNQGSSNGTTWTKLDGGCTPPQAQQAAAYHQVQAYQPPPYVPPYVPPAYVPPAYVPPPVVQPRVVAYQPPVIHYQPPYVPPYVPPVIHYQPPVLTAHYISSGRRGRALGAFTATVNGVQTPYLIGINRQSSAAAVQAAIATALAQQAAARARATAFNAWLRKLGF